MGRRGSPQAFAGACVVTPPAPPPRFWPRALAIMVTFFAVMAWLIWTCVWFISNTVVTCDKPGAKHSLLCRDLNAPKAHYLPWR